MVSVRRGNVLDGDSGFRRLGTTATLSFRHR